MTRSECLSMLSRLVRPAGLAATLAAVGWSATALWPSSLSAAAENEPLITSVARFQIPFDVEVEPGQAPAGFAVLFGSQDGGATWQQLQSVPVAQQAFNFAAPRDGRYSFAIRITDAQGNLQSSIEGSEPELEVVVDSVPPELKLDLTERALGEVVVSWLTTDAAVAAETLAIEFADGADGRWKPVAFIPAANGQALISASPGSVVSVRAAVMDAAGNRGEASTQLVCQSAAGLDRAPAHAGMMPPAVPLGPSPFENFPGSMPVPFASSLPTASGPAPASDVTAHYPEVTPAAALPLVQDAAPASALPPLNLPLPTDMSAAGFTMPSSFAGPGLSPSLPVAVPGEMQVVNNRVFDLEYQIEDVGPSGVSAVELFVTENGGRQWFRYGTDADLRSPFSVDAQGEGTFGFVVRIRNGLGFSDHPPQPGHAPEIVVTVDQSAPLVELVQPTMRTDGAGSIALVWRVSEQFPAATPVRLEYASTPNGPWTPVFDWQVDQGGYQWAVRPGLPPAVHFRLLARDAAGNVGSSQTAQPLVVDMKKPVGRLLRVQSASHSTTWPQ